MRPTIALPTCLVLLVCGASTGCCNKEGQQQSEYAFRAMEQISLAYQIRRGRAEEIVSRIDKAMPAYVMAVSQLEDKEMAASALQVAARYYRTFDLPIPEDLAVIFERLGPPAAQVCHPLLDICTGSNCTPIPTSLRPVDVSTTDPNNGWDPQRSRGCGTTKGGKNCGPPLGIMPCW